MSQDGLRRLNSATWAILLSLDRRELEQVTLPAGTLVKGYGRGLRPDQKQVFLASDDGQAWYRYQTYGDLPLEEGPPT